MRSNKTKLKASGSSKTFVIRKWHPQAPKKLGTINLGDYKIHSFLTTSKEYSQNKRKVDKHINTVEFYYFKEENPKFNILRDQQSQNNTTNLQQHLRDNQVAFAKRYADYMFSIEGTPSNVLFESLKLIKGSFNLRPIFLKEWDNVSNLNLTNHLDHIENVISGKKMDKMIPTSVYNQKSPNDILLAKIKKSEITFDVLSQKAQIPISTVYKHAQGEADIDRYSACKYAKFFGMDPSEILFNDIQIPLKGIVNFKKEGSEGEVIPLIDRYEYVICPRDVYRPDIQAVRIETDGSVYDNNIAFYYQSYDGKISNNQLCIFIFGDEKKNNIALGRFSIDRYGKISVKNPEPTITEDQFDKVKKLALGTKDTDHYPHNLAKPMLEHDTLVDCAISGQTLNQNFFKNNTEVKVLPIISLLNPTLTRKDERRSHIIKNEETWYKTSNLQNAIDQQNIKDINTLQQGDLIKKQIASLNDSLNDKVKKNKERFYDLLKNNKDQSVWRKADLIFSDQEGNQLDINALNKQIQKYTDQIKQRIKDTQEFTKQVEDITAGAKKILDQNKEEHLTKKRKIAEEMLSGPSWLVGLSPDDLSDKMLSYVAKEPKQAKDFFSDKSINSKVRFGEASGENRAKKAFDAAMNDPRFIQNENSLELTTEILIAITGGNDLTLKECDEIMNYFRKDMDPNAEVLFACIKDDDMDGSVRVSFCIVSDGKLRDDILLKNAISNFYFYQQIGLRKEALKMALSSPALDDSLRAKVLEEISEKIPQVKEYKTAEIYPFRKAI